MAGGAAGRRTHACHAGTGGGKGAAVCCVYPSPAFISGRSWAFTFCASPHVPFPVLQLGIGVFGSGPLLEAELLKDAQLALAVAAAPQLAGIDGTAPRLLQLARSSPGLLTSLVGHKAPAHVDANAALTHVPPLGEGAARAVLQGVQQSTQR